MIGGAILIIILILADFNNRMTELQRVTVQRERIAVQVTDLLSTQSLLETQIAQATSVAAVEEWAYEQGKMVRPGDELIVPLPGPSLEPTATPVPEETPPPADKWELWWALFFNAGD